jgi:anti-sigma regulatory factor (Ser/Thr protein kinase)
MAVETQCTLQASMSSLPLATAFVEDFCNQHDIAPNDRLRLALMAEELFTNTVLHGLGGDDARVRLALTVGAMQVVMVYEDTARPFNPLPRADQELAGLDAAITEGRVGGFGLVLVTQMADHVSYARVAGCNRLSVVLSRER